MFGSILDTVRAINDNQLIAIEAFLMRSALSGTPAVLSPNQAIDSAAIQLITEGNVHNSNNNFLKAVELGIVKVAIPEGYRTLIDYCLDTLKRGDKDPNNEFIFSSLKFLYEKVDQTPVFSYEERMAVLNYIFTALSEARLRKHTAQMPSFLTADQRIMVERYTATVKKLDEAVKGYESFASRKELVPKYIREALGNRLVSAEPKTEIADLIQTTIRLCENSGWPLYRSYYYRLCEQYSSAYSKEGIEEFRTIVDVCYNKVVALSLRDNAELNIAPSFSEVASIQAAEDNTEHSTVTASKIIDDAGDKLDWECLVNIYMEVDRLCEEKGLSWEEAMDLYRGRQTRLPFVLSGKYAVITSLTMAVSAIPVVGMLTGKVVSEFLWNMICDVSGEIVKKPSVGEIITMSKQAKKNNDMLDIIITQNNKEK